MFTGIIEAVGTLRKLSLRRRSAPDRRHRQTAYG